MEIKRCDVRDLGDIIEALEQQDVIEKTALYARHTLFDTSTYMWFRHVSTFFLFQKILAGTYSVHLIGQSTSFKDTKNFLYTVGKYVFSGTDCERIWCMVDKDNKRLQRLCGLLRFKRVAHIGDIIIYEFLASDRTEEEKLWKQQ